MHNLALLLQAQPDTNQDDGHLRRNDGVLRGLLRHSGSHLYGACLVHRQESRILSVARFALHLPPHRRGLLLHRCLRRVESSPGAAAGMDAAATTLPALSARTAASLKRQCSAGLQTGCSADLQTRIAAPILKRSSQSYSAPGSQAMPMR